jgi:hypothetical protein
MPAKPGVATHFAKRRQKGLIGVLEWKTMTVSRRFILACCCLLPLVVGLSPVFAQEARLTDMTVTNTRDDLLIYLRVEGAFGEETIQGIRGGVPATFSFLTSLYEVRPFWLDRQIADIVVTHTLHYETLKEEFTVTRSWEAGKPRVTRSLEEAAQWMTSVEGVKVVALKQLEKGRQYQLRAKAELSRIRLPFYLHYVLFFLSLWDFETDWYTVDFIY